MAVLCEFGFKLDLALVLGPRDVATFLVNLPETVLRAESVCAVPNAIMGGDLTVCDDENREG